MTDQTPLNAPPPPPAYVPPGPTQYPPQFPAQYDSPPAPPSRRRQRLGAVIVIAIAVAIGVGFVLFRDRLSNDVASLQPGECFDEPAAGDTAVTDVQRQPCNEAHDAEVFANVTHTAAAGATYPIALEFGDLAQDECVPRLVTYSGLTIEQLQARGVIYGYFYPTRDGWGSGDRVVMCYIINENDSKLTGSLRNVGSGASATP